MKNIQTIIEDDFLNSSTVNTYTIPRASEQKNQSNKQKANSRKIMCQKGNDAPFVYMNRKCDKYPFACQNKQCQCHYQHKTCIKTQSKTIIQNLMQSEFSYHDIQIKIQRIFQKAVNLLSDLRDGLLLKVKTNQQNYQYMGLAQPQINLITSLLQSTVADIKCQHIWNILLTINQQIQTNQILVKFQQKIDILENNFQEEIFEFSKEIQKQFMLINKYKVDYFKNSKIVKNPEEEIKLLKFFEQNQNGQGKVSKAEMLYRASDNQFQIQKFHQKCDRIKNTVTICQTQFGKIIGAFTAQEWYRNQKWEFFKDNTGESFVFSLTNGDRFINQNNQAGIVRRNDNTFGLQFGKNLEWDFLLANKANENDRSLANINTGYKNKNYTKGDLKSFQRFIGNPSGNTFRAKQWQVWRVQFQREQQKIKAQQV